MKAVSPGDLFYTAADDLVFMIEADDTMCFTLCLVRYLTRYAKYRLVMCDQLTAAMSQKLWLQLCSDL